MISVKILKILRLLPLAATVVITLVILFSGTKITVDTVLNYSPENYYIAAAVILFMFAVKSLSILIPIVILYIAVGTIYSPVPALLINFAGNVLCVIIPYWIGYITSGSDSSRSLDKHPKIKAVIERQRDNEWFMSYILRVVNCLPADAVSMYLGALKVNFGKYFSGSVLGNLPGIIAATFIGANITDPTSPMFIGTVVATVLITLISLVIYKKFIAHERSDSD